jgi:hypothetical protein
MCGFAPTARLWPALLTRTQDTVRRQVAYSEGVTELPGGVAVDQVQQQVRSAR